jgi:hypothetical protein
MTEFEVGDRVRLNRPRSWLGFTLSQYPAYGRIERFEEGSYAIVKLDYPGSYVLPNGSSENMPQIREAIDNLYPALPSAYRSRLAWYPVRLFPAAFLIAVSYSALFAAAPQWWLLWLFALLLSLSVLLWGATPPEVRD